MWGDQREVLGNHSDPMPDGIVWRVDRYRQAVYRDLSPIGLIQTIEDAHQSGLARPILTQQRVDLPGPQGEIDSVVGQYCAEALADPTHRYDWMKVTGHIFASVQFLQIPGSILFGASPGSHGESGATFMGSLRQLRSDQHRHNEQPPKHHIP
jgi:hypothetical protein